MRKTDRHQANNGHQRSCEHRRSSMAPSVGCGLDAIPAFFHLDDNRLDRDDRIVNQQAERKNERAERDAIKLFPGHQHDDERRRKCDWNRGGHDDANAPAETDKTDDHHHEQRHKEFLLELADSLL